MDNNKNVRIINSSVVVDSIEHPVSSPTLNVSCFTEAKKERDRKKASQKIRQYADQLGW